MKEQTGAALENKLNKVNIDYRKSKKALIVKKSTPIQLTRTGFSYQMSTVDYSGLYVKNSKVVPVAFDAKSTKNKTSFPLSNIESHQIEFLKLWAEVGGEAFILVYFSKLETSYKLPIDFILNFIENNDRKSIPYKDIPQEYQVSIQDYLNINETV